MEGDVTTAQRWEELSAGLPRRIEGVPEGRWESPAPPEGWVARDVVRHLVEWMPGLYLGSTGMPVPEAPSVDQDPAEAWRAVDHAVAAVFADPQPLQLPPPPPAGGMNPAGM